MEEGPYPAPTGDETEAAVHATIHRPPRVIVSKCYRGVKVPGAMLRKLELVLTLDLHLSEKALGDIDPESTSVTASVLVVLARHDHLQYDPQLSSLKDLTSLPCDLPFLLNQFRSLLALLVVSFPCRHTGARDSRTSHRPVLLCRISPSLLCRVRSCLVMISGTFISRTRLSIRNFH